MSTVNNTATRRKGSRVNHNYFDKIDTPNKAWLLGFLSADGCVIPKYTTIQFSLHCQDEHILRSIKSEINLQNVQIWKTCKASSDMVTIAWKSSQQIYSLQQVGVTERKTHTIQPWQGPQDLMPYYWLGVIDGDGHWVPLEKKKYHLSLAGNQFMMRGFADFVFHHTNYLPKVRKHSTKANEYTQSVSIKGLHRLQQLISLFYGNPDLTLFLKRKKDVAIQYLDAQLKCAPRDDLTKERMEALFAEHGSWNAVAKFLGEKNPSCLYRRAARFGIGHVVTPWHKIYSKEDIQNAVNEYGTFKEAAQHLGIHVQSMTSLGRRYGIKPQPRMLNVKVLRQWKQKLGTWDAVMKHFHVE